MGDNVREHKKTRPRYSRDGATRAVFKRRSFCTLRSPLRRSSAAAQEVFKGQGGIPIQNPRADPADRFRSRPEEAAPSPGPPVCPGIRLGKSSRKCSPLALYKFSFIVYNGEVNQVLPLTPPIIQECMKLCNRRIRRFV